MSVATPDSIPDLSGLGQPREMSIDQLPIEALWQNFGVFKKDGALPMGYPQHLRRLFAPADNVHGAIVAFCNAARVSVCSAMGYWSDDEIDQFFRNKLEVEQVPVQLTLGEMPDRNERELLKRWSADQVGNSVATGSQADVISHSMVIVVDGIITIQGSGEECTFTLDPVFAAETRARLDITHDDALARMSTTKGKKS